MGYLVETTCLSMVRPSEEKKGGAAIQGTVQLASGERPAGTAQVRFNREGKRKKVGLGCEVLGAGTWKRETELGKTRASLLLPRDES